MSQLLNFKDLSSYLQPHLISILTEYVSGGDLQGREYKAASIYGGRGSSFSFNIDTQKWADFNGGNQAGGDIISLVAMIKSIKQYEAAKILASQYGYIIDNSTRNNIPPGIDREFGRPSDTYIYKDILNQPTHVVFKYLREEKNSKGKQKKTFKQWHFSEPENKWVPRGTNKTPLYKLDQLHKFSHKRVVICEGEKAAEAASVLIGTNDYVTTCWMGGSATRAIKKTDFSSLEDRDVILWPDADLDHTGFQAMSEVAFYISQFAKTIKIIHPLGNEPDSFDAADLLELGLSKDELDKWLKQRVQQLKPTLNAPTGIDTASSPQTVVETPNSVGALHQPMDVSLHTNTLQPVDQARAAILWKEYNLKMKSNYKVFENEGNTIEILRQNPLFKDAFFFDTFKQCYMTTFESDKPLPVNKDIITKIKIFLQQWFFFGNISTEAVKNAVGLHLSQSPRINSLAEVINKYEWDKTPRINTFMEVILGVEPSDYVTSVSRIFWLQMVKRIIDPGSKADIMVIFEGEQGIKKSTVLETIAGEFFSVAGSDVSNKDFYIKLKGKFLIEMGELNTFSKSDHNHLKEVMSTRIDNFRDLFQSEDTPHPRTCVFVGTTNDQYYLKDETGNRRYLPVKCTKINIELLKQDLHQYFAEALCRLNAGEDHWEFPKEAHKLATDERSIDLRDEDPWEIPITEWVKNVKGVLIMSVLTDALGIHDKKFQTKRETNRVGKILKSLGFRHEKFYRKGDRVKGWVSDKTDYLYETCAEKLEETDSQKITRLEQEIIKIKNKQIFG